MVITFSELIGFVSLGLVILGLVVASIRYNANQRKQFYKRLDEDRGSSKVLYVGKDLCQLQHQYIKEALDEIKLFMNDMRKVLSMFEKN